MKARRLVAGVSAAAVLGLSVAACASGSGSNPTFKTGDCVVVGQDQTGNGTISGVPCGNAPADFDKVLSVVNNTNGVCYEGDRTFVDDVTGNTYCLEDEYNMAAGDGNSAAASPTPAPTPTSAFAFSFCSQYWAPLEAMNAAAYAATQAEVATQASANPPPLPWPSGATVTTWNQDLEALYKTATTVGQSQIAGDAYQAEMLPNYNPNTDQDLGAIALGNMTLQIAQLCQTGGTATGVSTVDTYTTTYPAKFVWYPGD